MVSRTLYFRNYAEIESFSINCIDRIKYCAKINIYPPRGERVNGVNNMKHRIESIKGEERYYEFRKECRKDYA